MNINQPFRMENLDCFFPDISTPLSREVLLGDDPIPYAFLVRKVEREYVVSYLDNKLDVIDEKIPTRQDSTLRTHHPELQSPLDVFEYIRSTSTKWLHPVPRANHDVGDQVYSPSENCCKICGLLSPKKSHDEHHRLVYCVNCDQVIPRMARKSHKCRENLFKCDFCDHSSLTQQRLSDHIRSIHQQQYKCDKVTEGVTCTRSFDTKKKLLQH